MMTTDELTRRTSVEAEWKDKASQLDIKGLLADGLQLLHVDDTATFFPEDPDTPGTGELPVLGGERIIKHINAITPYFGENQMGLYEIHNAEGNAFFASTYQALGIPKVAFSPDAEPADFTLTLDEFRTLRKSYLFPFDADRFEEYLEKSGGALTLWADHSRANTPGSLVHPGIQSAPTKRFIKGASAEVHHFGSADTDMEDAGTREHLQTIGGAGVLGVGLAEDYCLGTELLTLAHAGVPAYYLLEGTAAINAPDPVHGSTLTKMRRELFYAGVIGISFHEFMRQVRSHS